MDVFEKKKRKEKNQERNCAFEESGWEGRIQGNGASSKYSLNFFQIN